MTHGIHSAQSLTITPARYAEVPVTQPTTITPVMIRGKSVETTPLHKRTTYSVSTPHKAVTGILRIINELRAKAGSDLAIFTRLDANGMLGQLFATAPRETTEFCALYLTALEKDLNSFSDLANKVNGRKTLAIKKLADLKTALDNIENSPREFFNLLNTYEKTFNKVSLQTMLDAHFMELSGSEHIKLLSVTQESTLNPFSEQLQRYHKELGDNTLSNAIKDAEAELNDQPIVNVQSGAPLTESTLLTSYIAADPAIIKGMIAGWASSALLQESSDVTRSQAKQALEMDATPEAIHNLLDSNEDLRHNIMVDISSIHIGRLYTKLKNFDVTSASNDALIEARTQCQVFDQLQAQFNEELSAAEVKVQQKNLNTMQVHIQARMIQLMTTSEASKPPEKRLFWLNVPDTDQVIAKLTGTELRESTEARLYKSIVAYMDALQAFKHSGGHLSLITLQQARFDLLLHQQNYQAEEMKSKLTKAGYNDFDKDLALLKAIHACRQATAKYRPVMSKKDNAIHLLGNILWRDEEPFHDIVATLIHDKALNKLGYSFKEEFQAACSDCPEALSAFTNSLTTFISTAKTEITALLKSERSLFQILGLSREAYRALENSLIGTLRQMLVATERNPQLTRQALGDFAQMVPQLKKLFGLGNGELWDLLDQVSNRLSAESIASSFTGDHPSNLETDLATHPELARNLKRFQFFCDLASATLKGVTGLNAIKSALNGPIGMLGALFNMGTMHTTREVINHMPADEVRRINELFINGPVFGWVTTSPFNTAAAAARRMGQNKTFASAATSALFAPFTRRWNALTEAIVNIYHHKPGAWAALAVESAKMGAVLAASIGVTCIIATTVCTTGPLGIVGCAFTLAEMALMTATTGYGVARMIVNIEDSNMVFRTTEALATFYAQSFSENSSMTKGIRLRCEREAANMITSMKKQDAYQQQVSQLVAQCLFRNHWDKVNEQESHVAEVDSYLKQSEESRFEQAEALLKQVHILELITNHIDEANTIASDRTRLNVLRDELNTLGVGFLAPEAGLEHFLLNLKLSTQASLERQCGTTAPGDTADEIKNHLNNYQREVMLGNIVRETLTETHSPIIAETQAQIETAFYKGTTSRMASVEIKRVQQIIHNSIKEYISDREAAEGRQITAADLEETDLEKALSPKIERAMQQLHDVNTHWMESYKGQLRKLRGLSGLSESSLKGMMKAATTAAIVA
ncbi:hypothetical protein ACH42_04535 [Endozoicomonas sp. (ex Bugula neritina AB1)]|nr:hypothetical protein ACH42_04535 [Endozoicomonas sp. (ex Bugula neritina AB1)]